MKIYFLPYPLIIALCYVARLSALATMLIITPLQNIVAQEDDAFLNDEWKQQLAETNFNRTNISLNLLVAPNLIEDILAGISNPEFIPPIEGEVIHGKKNPLFW